MTLPPHRRREEEDEERVSDQLAQTTNDGCEER
jgi:hypothetical protein